ncbi:PDR/VanB family oxidoreductase [Streptomyces albogriseolus]|uniref:PDR/VanB family oxidoreductase n=1 Tax=Streptomyces albogriseolus TaxID=1887 RepID=UPI0034615CCC
MSTPALDRPAPRPPQRQEQPRPEERPDGGKRRRRGRREEFRLGARGRKLTLALHIASSVGWMGLSMSMATLALIGYLTSDPGVAEGAYYAMYVFDETTVSLVSLVSGVTGVLLGCGTPWGLLRHWWVLVKWVLALSVAVFAWVYTHPLVLTAAERAGETRGDTYRPGTEAAVLAWTVPPVFALLVFLSLLSVYKPWGRTPRGRRHAEAGARRRASTAGAPADTPVTVAAVDRLADGVVGLRLEPAAGGPVALWTAGAHIDLVLPSGRIRQYSLHGDPDDRSCYRVAVLKEPEGRGGSLEAHRLAAGDRIAVRGPRNHFPLADAERYLFVAGGIGVVPFLPMIEEAERRGADWRLVYVGRSRAGMAFLTELERYGPDRVWVHARDESERPDLAALLAASPAGTAVHCCGPDGMMRAVEELMDRACPQGTLHLERFTPSARPASPEGDRPFEIELSSTGEVVHVPAGRSALEALRECAPQLAASCEDGLCGSCELRVLAGTPDHRDDVLPATERGRTDIVYPCVSRARGARLVVDL